MKNLLLVLAFMLTGLSMSAQEIEIKGIDKKDFISIKEIEDKGYAVIYRGDKVKGGRKINISIYDYSLKELHDNSFVLPKKSYIIAPAFNQSNFVIGYCSEKQKEIKLFSYNAGGEEEGTFLKEDINAMNFGDAQEYYPKVFSAGKEGFYLVYTIKNKKYGYALEKVDNSLKVDWKSEQTPQKGMITVVDVFSSHNYIVITQMNKAKVYSTKADILVSAFENATGERMFSEQVNTAKYFDMPSAVIFDEEDNSFVISGIYFEGGKPKASAHDGLFIKKYNLDGSIGLDNHQPWSRSMEKLIVSRTKKIKDFSDDPKVFVLDIVKSDGKYVIVSEFFKVGLDGVSTALSAIGGNSPDMRISTRDMILFTLNQNSGDVEKIYIQPKETNGVTIEGLAVGSSYALSYYAKRYNLFSYRFVNEVEDGYAIIYYNVQKNKPYVGVSTIVDGRLKTEKYYLNHSLKGSRSDTNVLRCTGGKLMFYEYDAKAEVLTMTIEDIEKS